jgi:nitric oxide dioxygenase
MTPADVALVQSSFSKVVPIADAAASLFYSRLFDIAPEFRPLFKNDISEQGSKLMATLGFVVNGLNEPETVLPAAKTLAVKHVSYGVRSEHYAPVGEALIWTLQQGLGDEFTDDVKDAWLAAYTALSGAMIEAAYSNVPATE